MLPGHEGTFHFINNTTLFKVLEAFKGVKTTVTQGDGFSPDIFDCALEKDISEKEAECSRREERKSYPL